MFKALSIFVILVMMLVPAGLWWLAQTPLPAMEGLVRIGELGEPVVVRLDARGVPYIEARSDGDMYLAQGYVTARDRMFQMDTLRRVALGRLSEVYGPTTLSSDKLMRTVGIGRSAAAELGTLPTGARANLDAYCRGINLYLLEYLHKLPLEFRLLGYVPDPWKPEDSLAIVRYLSYTQDESWQLDDLRQRVLNKLGEPTTSQLFNEDVQTTPVAGLPAPQLAGHSAVAEALGALSRQKALPGPRPNWGSTAWALASSRTDSGGAIIACDKHTAFVSPDPWYLCTLSGQYTHAAGATIPGAPGVFYGRNADIAWGSASLKADVQDLFIEEFSPNLPNQYRTSNGWRAADEVVENIPVRFAKDVVHKVLVTRHGPVLLRNGNTGVSLAWTGTTPAHSTLTAVWALNRARNWEEFQRALTDFTGSPQVFVFADRAGSVGYQAAGVLPVRAGKGQGNFIASGWQPEGQWTGTVPPTSLPSGFRPASGAVVAANQRLATSGTGWLIGHQFCPPYRALRAGNMLAAFQTGGRHAGLPDMNDMQSDQLGPLASLVRKEIRDSVARTELIDKLQLSAMDLLDHWDGALKAESSAAAVYEVFVQVLARRLVEPKLGADLSDEYFARWAMWPTLVERYLRDKPGLWLPPEERTHPAFILTTFAQAVKDLRLALRTDDASHWSWGSLHRLTFKHIITRGLPWAAPFTDSGPLGVGGDSDTLAAIDVTMDPDQTTFTSESGPTLRLIADLSDQDKIYMATTLGQSGQFFSPYRTDQLKSWLRVDPMPLAFSASQADRQAQHKFVLTNYIPAKSE